MNVVNEVSELQMNDEEFESTEIDKNEKTNLIT